MISLQRGCISHWVWDIAQHLMHGVSSVFRSGPLPSPNTPRTWPWSRGLVQEEKKLHSWCVKHQRQCVIFSLKWAVWNVHLKELEWVGTPLWPGRHGAEQEMFYVYMFVRNAFFWLWLRTWIWSYTSVGDTHAASISPFLFQAFI